ncbi:MAG: Tyrocidine synthase 3 [Herbaspirillum frisingense]|uniref:Tyrocidine synthase 3 n=1 Tax=Herbaspirillum frisingense TaxID=92645 RepID=A0A7V8FW48_9BURK|nr:MAG: Tyrocidine synthase 3 [Herbaspirillum frisingense]
MKLEPTGGQRRSSLTLRAKEGDFWREKFRQDPSNCGFAADFAGGAVSRRKSVLVPVSADLAAHLATVSKGNQQALALIMMAGIAIVASRYSGRKQVVVGAEGWKEATDQESGVVPIVVTAAGTISLRNNMARIADDLRSAKAHLPYSFDALAYDMGREGDATNPFYDISVIREARRPNLSHPLAPAGINVYWAATETGKHIAASYDENRFKESTVKTILRLTAHCLLNGLADMDKSLDDIPLFESEDADLLAKVDAPAKRREEKYSH